jgi:hypothetical protein
MSRSYDFPGLPGKLNDALLLELLPAPCAQAALTAMREDGLDRLGRCPACRDWHIDPLSDPAIPAGALVAALVRRRWSARVARRHVAYDQLGRRYRHVPHDYGAPRTFRAWRQRAKVLVAADRADEIPPWSYDRGYTYW